MVGVGVGSLEGIQAEEKLERSYAVVRLAGSGLGPGFVERKAGRVQSHWFNHEKAHTHTGRRMS